MFAFSMLSAMVALAPKDATAEARGPARFLAELHCATPADTPTRAAIAKLVARRFPRFRLVAGKPRPGQASLGVKATTARELPPPSLEEMRHRTLGLTEAEQQALAATKGAVVIDLNDDVGPPARAVDEMNALLAELARPNGCFITDASSRLTFSGRTWQARPAERDGETLHPMRQANKHFYLNGSLYRIVTLGMEKFGLPDIAIDQFPSSYSDRMGSLCDWIADGLAAGKLEAGGWLTLPPRDQGASGREQPRVRLELAQRDEGDADNVLLTVDFSAAAGASLQERQGALLTQLFGASPERKLMAPPGDPELVAASARARQRLSDVAARFARGLPFPQKLHMKKAFVMPNGTTEFMWFQVTGWKDGVVDGVLLDDAFDPKGPRAGVHVRCTNADVYDYAIHGYDGAVEGNETTRILEAREKRKKQ